MSYDIELVDAKGEVIEFDTPHDIRGGTYEYGGTRRAWLNVTYNYGKFFQQVLGPEGIQSIYGMTANDSIPVLGAAIAKLKTDTDPNYWTATEGNARVALEQLLQLALLAPHGVWQGD